MFDMSNMKDMFQQVRTAQKQMKEMKKELAKMRVEGETGGGMVKATVDGEFTLVDLQIDQTLLEPDDIKALPRLIMKAIQTAQKNAKNQVMEKAKDMTGGMNIPGLDL